VPADCQALHYLSQKINDRILVQFFMVSLIAITLQTVVTGPLTDTTFAQFLCFRDDLILALESIPHESSSPWRVVE
jgi:hypothetical protein